MWDATSSPDVSMRTMEELQAHVPNQTLKINRLINLPTRFANFVEEEGGASWATFRNSVWGNASALAPSEASEWQGLAQLTSDQRSCG